MKRKSKPGWNARSLRAKWRIFQFSERRKKSLGSRRSRSPIITHDCVITVEGEDLCPTLHPRGLSSNGKMAEGAPRTDVSAAARNLKGFKGITGAIEFDNKGDPVKAKYFVLQFDKQSDPGKVVKVIDQQEPAAAKKS